MRKLVGYIPAVFFTVYYFFYSFASIIRFFDPMTIICLVCLWLSGVLLHKGCFWGGAVSLIPLAGMVCMSNRFAVEFAIVELIISIVFVVFYCVYGYYLWKRRGEMQTVKNKELAIIFLKVTLTVLAIMLSVFAGVFSFFILMGENISIAYAYISMLVLPSLLLPLIWLKKRKKFILIWLIPAVIFFTALGVSIATERCEQSITINTTPNINIHEYFPFKEDSKIVKYDSKTLKLTEDLPIIDGAAALFPVYSAFVNATYPDTTELNHGGAFQYNNTPGGYKLLAEKQTDIFIGVYPSDEQQAYAQECNTTFEYTPIGSEGFVFFVHKDNPIENLTTEQIQGIYSGEITNWKQVGGKNEKIEAFQRNEGSGSQSMLERFMGDKPIMEAPTELRNDLMVGIIERVSNYKNRTNSIGFSFRYYVEGIIKNPNIKMLSIDGVAPTAENIKNGTYPVVTPIYAVTYKEQTNENVDKLLDWILSDEGQSIIEETGYVGVR